LTASCQFFALAAPALAEAADASASLAPAVSNCVKTSNETAAPLTATRAGKALKLYLQTLIQPNQTYLNIVFRERPRYMTFARVRGQILEDRRRIVTALRGILPELRAADAVLADLLTSVIARTARINDDIIPDQDKALSIAEIMPVRSREDSFNSLSDDDVATYDHYGNLRSVLWRERRQNRASTLRLIAALDSYNLLSAKGPKMVEQRVDAILPEDGVKAIRPDVRDRRILTNVIDLAVSDPANRGYIWLSVSAATTPVENIKSNEVERCLDKKGLVDDLIEMVKGNRRKYGAINSRISFQCLFPGGLTPEVAAYLQNNNIKSFSSMKDFNDALTGSR